MAIDVKKIHEEKTVGVLSDEEMAIVKRLELHTDEKIKNEYGFSPDFKIVLDSAAIDKPLSKKQRQRGMPPKGGFGL